MQLNEMFNEVLKGFSEIKHKLTWLKLFLNNLNWKWTKRISAATSSTDRQARVSARSRIVTTAQLSLNKHNACLVLPMISSTQAKPLIPSSMTLRASGMTKSQVTPRCLHYAKWSAQTEVKLGGTSLKMKSARTCRPCTCGRNPCLTRSRLWGWSMISSKENAKTHCMKIRC